MACVWDGFHWPSLKLWIDEVWQSWDYKAEAPSWQPIYLQTFKNKSRGGIKTQLFIQLSWNRNSKASNWNLSKKWKIIVKKTSGISIQFRWGLQVQETENLTYNHFPFHRPFSNNLKDIERCVLNFNQTKSTNYCKTDIE